MFHLVKEGVWEISKSSTSLTCADVPVRGHPGQRPTALLGCRLCIQDILVLQERPPNCCAGGGLRGPVITLGQSWPANAAGTAESRSAIRRHWNWSLYGIQNAKYV